LKFADLNSYDLPDDVFEAGETKPQKKAPNTNGRVNGVPKAAHENLTAASTPASTEMKKRSAPEVVHALCRSQLRRRAHRTLFRLWFKLTILAD
jgi:hypothetical protein